MSAGDLPEPLAHPTLLSEPDSSEPIRSRVSQRRLGVALFIVGFGWVFANASLTNVLLAAKLAVLAPDNKVFLLGVTTAIGGVGTTLALFVWGTVSDLTRSRFGRRTPWIISGAVTAAAFLTLMALATTVGTFLAAYVGYGLLFNALPAAVLAVFADRIPRAKRGTASAVYGGSQVVGGAIASIIASRFISHPSPPLFVAAFVVLVAGFTFALVAPDYSSLDQPRAKLDLRGVLQAFKFPTGAPDFYWAFAGRFLLLLGLATVTNFTLYILTDYIGLSNDKAGDIIAISGIASLVSLTAGTLIAGPLSDRIGRRKLPIFVASLLFGVSVLIPFVWPTSIAMIIFGAVSGLGLGAFLSVDAALMTEVIPSQESHGKELGILNTANTVPQIIAPLVTSSIIGFGFGYPPLFIVALALMLLGAISIFKIKSVR